MNANLLSIKSAWLLIVLFTFFTACNGIDPTFAGPIGDQVWLDSNADGIQNNLERGVKDVKVELFSNTGDLVAITTTDAFGQYTFDDPDAGEYYLHFIPPPGHFFTQQHEGDDDTSDSDVDPRDGLTDVFTVESDQTNRSFDAGLLTGDFDDPPTKTSSPTLTPTPTPPFILTTTPFMGGESTHTLRGAFIEGTIGCGYPPSFDDDFILTIEGSTITIRQPSTGDVNTGIINPDGSFKAMSDDGHEFYDGIFNADWSGEAIYKYADSDWCITTYKVVFTPK